MHHIDDKHSHVAKVTASCSQVGERLVARRVNNQKAGDLIFDLINVIKLIKVLFEVFPGEIRGTDLLSDTASFASLHVGLAQLVKDQRLARVDVAHDANDGAAQFLWLLLLLKVGCPLFLLFLQQQPIPLTTCLRRSVVLISTENRSALLLYVTVFLGLS